MENVLKLELQNTRQVKQGKNELTVSTVEQFCPQ